MSMKPDSLALYMRILKMDYFSFFEGILFLVYF